MNVKRILCPVDFSEHSESALAYATSLAKEHEAELHIVHTFEEPYAYGDRGFGGYVATTDMEPTKQQLEAVAPPSPEVPFKREFLVGPPATSLIDYAKEHEIDLIVMGTHGRTGVNRLLMGSVAEAVVRRAPCPVLTIKHPAEADVAAS